MTVFTTLLILYHAILSSATVTTTQKQILVDDHNAMRTKVATGQLTGDDGWIFPTAADMKQLEWSDTIATDAQNYANDCVYAHSTQAIDGYGENIAAAQGTWDEAALKGRIQAWLDDEAPNTKFSGTGVNWGDKQCSGVCGHFTQGIWGPTGEIGCGYKRCDSNDTTNSPPDGWNPDIPWNFLVCNYFVRGNVGYTVNGVMITNVYTTGTPCSSCPSGYQNCVNSLCAASTPSPTSPTNAPSAIPTDAPVVPAAIPSCLDLTFWSGAEGIFTKCTGGAAGSKPAYYQGAKAIKYHSYFSGYGIFSETGGYYDYCADDDITNCLSGSTWNFYPNMISISIPASCPSASPCPNPAQSNPEVKITDPLQIKDKSSNNVNSYPFNMTEMHIILGLLILVLITMCGMIFGFCYYLKNNNKNEKQRVNVQENEMVYFESENIDEHNSPTVENVNDSNQNQPSLKISVNGTTTMVTKLPTTTPVTPLINVDQNYE